MADEPAKDRKKQEPPRRRGMASVSANVSRVLGPALKKRGVAIARLIANWSSVVGPELAQVSAPERVVRGKDGRGTLVITVAGPFALEMQHLEPLVLEKVNGFLGGQTIERLRLEQGHIDAPAPRRRTKPAPPPDPAADARLAEMLADVEDEDLRRALTELGRSVAAGQD